MCSVDLAPTLTQLLHACTKPLGGKRFFKKPHTGHHSCSPVIAWAIQASVAGPLLLLLSSPFCVARGSFLLDGDKVNTTTTWIFHPFFGIVDTPFENILLTPFKNEFHISRAEIDPISWPFENNTDLSTSSPFWRCHKQVLKDVVDLRALLDYC